MSTEVNAKISPTITVPSAPNSVTATAGSSSVAIGWSVPSSDGGSAITGYNIYRGTTSGGETFLASLGLALQYIDWDVKPGTTYYYELRAVNAIGMSSPSNEVKTAILSAPTKYIELSANPSGLSETPGSQSTITAKVLNQLGNPLVGVTVFFSSSTGSLSLTSAVTDAQGQASVWLVPNLSTTSPVNAIITASIDGISATATVAFTPSSTSVTPPPNWKEDTGVFLLRTTQVPIQQYFLPTVKAYYQLVLESYNLTLNGNMYASTLSEYKSIVVSLDNLPPLNIYAISETSTTSQEQQQFSNDLEHYFEIESSTNYQPTSVLIIEIPFEPLIDALFGWNLHGHLSIPLPIPPGFGGFSSTHLETTPSGDIDFAIAFSKCSILPTDTALNGLSNLGSDMELLIKNIIGNHPFAVIQSAVSALVGDVESIGDISLSQITFDLNDPGQLNSYSIIDLKNALDYFSTVSGIVLKILDMISSGGETLAAAATVIGVPLAIWKGASTVVSFIDLGLEIASLIPQLSNSTLYEAIAAGVGVIDTWMDPDNTTIVPSVYDSSGSLILGYNSSSDNIEYANPSGMLFSFGGAWLAYLDENPKFAINYTMVLNEPENSMVKCTHPLEKVKVSTTHAE